MRSVLAPLAACCHAPPATSTKLLAKKPNRPPTTADEKPPTAIPARPTRPIPSHAKKTVPRAPAAMAPATVATGIFQPSLVDSRSNVGGASAAGLDPCLANKLGGPSASPASSAAVVRHPREPQQLAITCASASSRNQTRIVDQIGPTVAITLNSTPRQA